MDRVVHRDSNCDKHDFVVEIYD